MENEDRPVARLVDLYRDGYRAYVRFMCAFHGGEPAARAAEPARRTPRDSPEKAP